MTKKDVEHAQSHCGQLFGCYSSNRFVVSSFWQVAFCVRCWFLCSLDIVRYLVEQNSKALEKGDEYGELPLHLACQNSSCSLEMVRYLLEQYPNALEQQDGGGIGMMPLHSCIWSFKTNGIDYPDLLDRMRLLLPGHPEAIDIVPFVPLGMADLWSTPKEHALYKEVAGLLLEEIPLGDQWEWARQVVEALSWMSSSTGVETTRLWATEWRDVCRKRLDAIEARLAALESLLEEAR